MSEGKRGSRRSGSVVVVTLVFLALAAALFLMSLEFSSPVPVAVAVPAWAIDISPVRHPSSEPVITHSGYEYKCSDCHDLFPSPSETTRHLTQHTHISLKHGTNTRCFNCHHTTNRDYFSDDFGAFITYDNPEVLCAKCHGLVYRDWQNGIHGRSNGYWSKYDGETARLKCTECHDPHQPPFPPMQPAPGPHTLRMGTPPDPDHGEHDNPLLQGHGKVVESEAGKSVSHKNTGERQ